MGIAMAKFPNLFFLYGPQVSLSYPMRPCFSLTGNQAPTAFSNGPSCTQVQAEWIERTIRDLTAQDITRFEAKTEAEDDWCKRMKEKWDASLFPKAKSWYQGSNIPGKRVEALNW